MSNDFDSYRVDYQLVAASQTAKVLKGQLGVGKAGDVLDHLVIIPLTLAAGTVSIGDGVAPNMQVFTTGTLADLSPIYIPLKGRSVIGAWQITTGANVQVWARGRFQ